MWAETEPLDPGVFGSLVELGADTPGFLAEIVEEFRLSTGRHVAAMRDAVREGDAEALRFAAHSLRGSSGTIGARGMAMLAASLEHAPAASRETGWPLIQRLEAEYEAVRRALDGFLPATAAASMS